MTRALPPAELMISLFIIGRIAFSIRYDGAVALARRGVA